MSSPAHFSLAALPLARVLMRCARAAINRTRLPRGENKLGSHPYVFNTMRWPNVVRFQ